MQVHTRASHGPCFTTVSHKSQGRESLNAGGDSIRAAWMGLKQRYRLGLYSRFARGTLASCACL